jgi:hypothetical protein
MKRWTPRRLLLLGICTLALSLPGWWLAPASYLAAYLAAWWFCLGIVLGGPANLWVHNLTGGRWGEPLREPLLAAGAVMPVLAVLFVPVLLGISSLYPWATDADSARWASELARPEFKREWLAPGSFIARALAYLVAWSVLALMSLRPRLQRSKSYSAAALIVYGITLTLASIDWIMSLVPQWYSTTFGLLTGTGQMLTGLAYGIVVLALREPRPERSLFADWGNLLLMYVLTWAYLAYTQYLIIWAENLPQEISWYLPRLHTAWWWAGWALILGHFFLPLLILLSRAVKHTPRSMGALAAALLAMHLIDVWWLTLPSVGKHTLHAWWFAPLLAVGLVALLLARALSRAPAPIAPPVRDTSSEERAHA